mgnify:CR=1 FL=1
MTRISCNLIFYVCSVYYLHYVTQMDLVRGKIPRRVHVHVARYPVQQMSHLPCAPVIRLDIAIERILGESTVPSEPHVKISRQIGNLVLGTPVTLSELPVANSLFTPTCRF